LRGLAAGFQDTALEVCNEDGIDTVFEQVVVPLVSYGETLVKLGVIDCHACQAAQAG